MKGRSKMTGVIEVYQEEMMEVDGGSRLFVCAVVATAAWPGALTYEIRKAIGTIAARIANGSLI